MGKREPSDAGGTRATPPVVLMQSWNEVGEGSYLVPTDADGYGYMQAIARSVGIPWTAPPKRTLRVSPSTRGSISSIPAGISCPPRCSASFDEGWEVTLTARPGRSSVFDGWVGACTENKTRPTCPVVLVRDSTVRAMLTPAVQRRHLTLALSGGRARGRLAALDGYRPCIVDEPVVIQRLRGARWTTSASTLTRRHRALRRSASDSTWNVSSDRVAALDRGPRLSCHDVNAGAESQVEPYSSGSARS